MPNRSILPILASLLCLLVPLSAHAFGVPTIRLAASRYAVLSDGKDATELVAEPLDSSGRPMPDGTEVTFTTSLGSFRPSTIVRTQGGSARVRLSSQQKGTATVQAVVSGGGFAKLDITFTDDPAETFQGNAYAAVDSTGPLLYSAGDRVIEASGRVRLEDDKAPPGAHMTYRNIDIYADALQLDCTANVVRARGNVRVRKAGRTLQCGRLYLPLMGGDGWAIAEVDKRLKPVQVKGTDLSVSAAEYGVASTLFEMVDLTEAKLAITARQILLFPGEKLQFKRPRFYQDGQPLMGMPFYELALYSSQLFADQFMSVGTQGFSMDVPLYYDLTPVSTGIFHVRHGERSGPSIYATRPGWSLDLTQDYNSLSSSRRYTGEVGLIGISRGDWGLRWTHSQEFSSATRSTFFLDMPQHRTLFASTNLNQELGLLHMGLNLAYDRSLSGPSMNGNSADAYIETMARPIARTGYLMAVGGTASYSRSAAGDFRSMIMSQGVQARLFSRPFKLDRDTTLSNYITVGNLWSNAGNSGPSMLASLNATRSFGNSANLMLTYDFTHQPGMLAQEGSHRVGATFAAAAGSKWRFYLYNSLMLDARSASLVGEFAYEFLPRWRFTLYSTYQRFTSGQYNDLEFGIERSIGGRSFVLTYSTFSRRISFDLEASRF